MSEAAIVRRLRERVDELEETVRQLTAKEEAKLVLPHDVPPLRPAEARLMSALLQRHKLSKHGAYYALFGDREDRQMRTVDVWLHFLRRRLEGTRYRIKTHWGEGYVLEIQAPSEVSNNFNMDHVQDNKNAVPVMPG